MKRKILSLALTLALVLTLIPSVTASDTVITFPDPNFEAAVRERIGKPTGDILVSDVAEVTELSVNGREISDLTGIEHFAALTWLFVWGNQLTTLDVSRNTALTRLAVYDNQLTTLDVSKNTELYALSVSDNQLTTLDVSNNTALADLNVSNNQLTTLNVSGATALTELAVYDNQLTTLDVSNNTALTYLSVTNNQLTTLNVSGATALEYLQVDDNQLTELDVSNNTALIGLTVDNNQLTTLDVSNNTTLEWLTVSNNQLTMLDVSNNTALTSLDVYGNLMGQDPAVSVPAWTKSPALNLETYDGDWQEPLFFYFPQGDGTPSNPLDTAASWARDHITSALEKGFVPADIQGNYTQTITRQEFARMAVEWVKYALDETDLDAIVAAHGRPEREGLTFSDTSDANILAAYRLGITAGAVAPTADAPGQFNPNGDFTRQEAATMIMNTCRAIGADISNPPTADFADLSATVGWAQPGINFVRANGIMSGDGTNFNPTNAYTRQESIITFNNIEPDELP
ncbi:MAG: S-layer homology domain-containing protein [Oscillospiraceae bacterium]|nr:S-layer homology domain-containing protein [Oscillospiraceae bacterium]